MNRGDKVRITADNLGVLSAENPYKFEPEITIGNGEVLTYLAPQETVEGSWHSLLWSDADGADWICPAHESMFEPV